MNQVVYEGATNTTITCQKGELDQFVDWQQIPFTGSSKFITTNGQLNPAFNEFFAVDHPQGTQVFTLVVFNATISPSDEATISTAGYYKCYVPGNGVRSFATSILVVIRKYEQKLNTHMNNKPTLRRQY